MVEGSCHCGEIKVNVAELPDKATQCNCSMCRRYSALWAFCTEQTVKITTGSLSTEIYCWGDQYINFHRCAKCGCVTHYTSNEKADSDRVGVNLNMMPESALTKVTVRRFNGTDTWEYLD